MPKQKTHSGASKRFRVTASGLVQRKKCNLRHNLRKKTKKQKRNLVERGYVHPTRMYQMRELLHIGIG